MSQEQCLGLSNDLVRPLKGLERDPKLRWCNFEVTNHGVSLSRPCGAVGNDGGIDSVRDACSSALAALKHLLLRGRLIPHLFKSIV